MSSSSSSSATSTKTRDGRVAGDNGAIGVSAEGDVSVHIVPDEAFMLAEHSIDGIRDLAESAGEGAIDAIAEMRSLAEGSNQEAHESARDSIAAFGDMAGDAIDAISGLAESNTRGARDTLSDVTGQFAGALARTQQHARSESTQIAEQLIKIGLPAAALAFAISKVWGK